MVPGKMGKKEDGLSLDPNLHLEWRVMCLADSSDTHPSHTHDNMRVTIKDLYIII